jgi:hypothetical protein
MFEGKNSNIYIFLIYFSVFISSIELFKYPFEFYVSYFIFLLFLPALLKKYGLRSIPKVLTLFAFLFVNGVVQISLGNNTNEYFYKIFFGTFFSYIFYYLVVVDAGFDTKRLFDLYLKACYVVCIIGLVQFIGYQIGVPFLYDYSWLLNKWGVIRGGNFGIRINSVFPEPTYFSTSVSLAVFVALNNLLTKENYYFTKFQSFLVFAVSLLSFSGVGYFGLFITLILIFINYGLIRYALVFIPILTLVFFQLYQNVPEFSERYDSTVEVFSTGNFKLGKTHGSSLILYNNYQVAVRNFKDYFLGTGLGSHPVAFAKYSLTKNVKTIGVDLNGMDANSMFNRLLSETGIVGVGLFLLIIFKGFVKRNIAVPFNNSYWIISNSILTLILLNLLRQGHYFLHGFPLLVWIYYYNKQNYLAALEAQDQSHAEASVNNIPVNA